MVFGAEPTYAKVKGVPSINDALLVADSKYMGFFEAEPPTISFRALGERGSEQVKGMIFLAQMTKGKTFVFLGRESQSIGRDVQEFAAALGVSVELLSNPLIK